MNIPKRGLKICLAVFFVFLIILATVIITLIFTVFKPKNPEITVKPMGFPFPNGLSGNVTVKMAVTIVNRNYGSFSYENSTGYVNFQDIVVAEVPLESKRIPARRTVNLTTSADFMIGKLIKDPNFWKEIAEENGTVVLRSVATLPGKATMLKIFKKKATVHNTCDISLHIASLGVDSKCVSKIKL
ncbi:uncharacterized protein LOC114762975 [Neltuma alba]|uniref:uncharacterized protein LOC114762975 n=1 Tax=Neltuma alba TaxID=207710 RepID=UPI0010A4C870|nr:uncharacterized protein LOC114762975 [Prosopis alba]